MNRRPAIWMLVWLVASGTPVLAEQLVTHEGARIEIRGSWQQRGAMVIFTSPNGTLSSLRASEVDFDATALANTSPAPSPPAEQVAAETAAPAPILVLTDRDIAHGSPATVVPLGSPRTHAGSTDVPAAAGGAESTAGLAASADAAAGSVFVALDGELTVHDWTILDRGVVEGLELTGTLINDSTVLAVDLTLRATVPGPDGEDLTFDAFLPAPTLGAGRTMSFRVPLVELVSPPESPIFEIGGRGLRPRIVPQRPPANDLGEERDDQIVDPRDGFDENGEPLSVGTSGNLPDQTL